MKKIFIIIAFILGTLGVSAQSKKISALPTATNLNSSFVPIIQDSAGQYVNRKSDPLTLNGLVYTLSTDLTGDPGQERFKIDSLGNVDFATIDFITQSTGNTSFLNDGGGLLTFSSTNGGYSDLIIDDTDLALSSYDGVSDETRIDITPSNMAITITNDAGSSLDFLGSDGAGNVVWGVPSDIRLKKDISPIQKAYQKVMKLKPVNFTYKKGDEKTVGFIAQDVEKVLPEMVSTKRNGMKHLKTTTYLEPYIIATIQEMDKQIKALQKEVKKLKNKR